MDKNLKESKKRSKKEEEDRRREEKQRLKEEKAALKAAKENKGEKEKDRDRDRDRDRDKDREKVLNMRPRSCMRAHASMHLLRWRQSCLAAEASWVGPQCTAAGRRCG